MADLLTAFEREVSQERAGGPRARQQPRNPFEEPEVALQSVSAPRSGDKTSSVACPIAS